MELPINGESIKTADSVRETINQDGAVLLDIKQGLCFSMNPVGAKIWEMLKSERTLDQIANTLAQEFQVPRAQIEVTPANRASKDQNSTKGNQHP